MAWYSAGTVSVTNGSKVVTGSGTAWFGALQAGWGFVGPDGRVVEIDTVDSATIVTLKRNYQGSTASGQSYGIFPTNALDSTLANRLQALIENYQGVYDAAGQGKFSNGTLSAPGIRFEADPDTGVRRPASNTIALTAGGADKLSVSGNTASGDVVQSSARDATAGKLLTVGAFGLGSAAVVSATGDLDDITDSGFYQTDATTGGRPPKISNGLVLHMRRTPTIHVQLAISRSVSNPGHTCTRAKDSAGNWSEWRTVYDEARVLGTVTQSNGIPTGALFQAGSGVNGEFLRFADGTQICWHAMNIGSVVDQGAGTLANPYRTNATNWDFPAAFLSGSTPMAMAIAGVNNSTDGIRRSVAAHIRNMDQTRAYQVQVTRLSSVSDDDYAIVRLLAIGRWF